MSAAGPVSAASMDGLTSRAEICSEGSDKCDRFVGFWPSSVACSA
jgi:hypothetical protein